MWTVLYVGFLPIVAVLGVTLVQHPRELTVREGEKVTFQCSMRGDSMSYYYMSWYRQGPRGTVEWIYWYSDKYGDGFQDRFKGTVESYRNSFTL
ncbi:KV5AF protein, partial [Scytalopus superciliaris]|nr:KV5AF protein [Scytalopus superciliaris]